VQEGFLREISIDRRSTTNATTKHQQIWEDTMTKITPVLSKELSRRTLFKAACGTVGTIALVGLTSNEVLAAKMSKDAAGYQASPKSGASCAKCKNFAAPSACSVVDGNVSPNGWCSLFTAA
jgi:hypothetical protein